MVNVPSPFGGSDDTFDTYDEFVPGHAPAPGDFLDGHDVLDGREHLAVHRLARELFEERAVYDMTFGYNLARLNNDRRHPDAGYRYAVERPGAVDDDLPTPDGADREVQDDEARVLRAEFTPTTAFCPQSDTLTRGSLRAWNGLAERHEFELVRVRVAPMHQRATGINAALREAEATLVETGELPEPEDGNAATPRDGFDGDAVPESAGRDGSRAPF
ncbi:hypothetical protein C475_04356 [Halosimplex carlsbadense 2-9-1]|uniref:DUF7998 domain-containing protein n=1 Tax=Halosimplex carlsbadense 2-9-1 TaxID=797114 RepID=M0D3V0_9EURY|nr:hypothetical protein [Halosimplex carlsbadense]ELZ28839.1 hypothetical protein C475_04356 [Halosimplex carlsbadense 2-9-1]